MSYRREDHPQEPDISNSADRIGRLAQIIISLTSVQNVVQRVQHFYTALGKWQIESCILQLRDLVLWRCFKSTPLWTTEEPASCRTRLPISASALATKLNGRPGKRILWSRRLRDNFWRSIHHQAKHWHFLCLLSFNTVQNQKTVYAIRYGESVAEPSTDDGWRNGFPCALLPEATKSCGQSGDLNLQNCSIKSFNTVRTYNFLRPWSRSCPITWNFQGWMTCHCNVTLGKNDGIIKTTLLTSNLIKGSSQQRFRSSETHLPEEKFNKKTVLRSGNAILSCMCIGWKGSFSLRAAKTISHQGGVSNLETPLKEASPNTNSSLRDENWISSLLKVDACERCCHESSHHMER